MSAKIINTSPYLRTSRDFTEGIDGLTRDISKAYIDTAEAVNVRTIGLFSTNKASIGGEGWFLTSTKQQNLRQVYRFSDTALTVPHGITLTSLTNFVRIWATFFDGTYWQTLPYVDVLNVTNQINVKIDATNIIITKGAGAPPACTNGLVILEWISNP